MARPRSTAPKTEQLNIRLTESQADALHIIEFLDRTSGVQFVRDLLDDALAARMRTASFQRAAALLREEDAVRSGVVTRLATGGEPP